MIIKGRAVGNISHWSRYLRAQGENEKVIEHEIRGTLARDLRGALEEWRDLSTATRTEGDFMYHASLNPMPGEVLTPEQWRHSVDLLEKELGFEGHQRVIYEHVKEGRSHYHVLWNRVDPETMTIRDIQGDRYTCRRVANQLEREFGLTRTKAVRNYGDARPYHEWELKRSPLDVKLITKEITELWYSTKTGREFTDAIEHAGYIVTKGDRRDFCIIDPTGKDHSLARRIAGNNTRALRERMKDIDRDSLPTVAEGRARQRERLAERIAQEPARERLPDVADEVTWRKPMPERPQERQTADRALSDTKRPRDTEPRGMSKTTALVADLLQAHPDPHAFVQALDDKKLILARADAGGIAQLQNDINLKNIEAYATWRAAKAYDENLPQPRPKWMPRLNPGDLVIVDYWDNVRKLDPKHLDLAALEKKTLEGGREDIPTLSQAREIQEEHRQSYWEKRAERQAQAIERASNPSSGEAGGLKRNVAGIAQTAIRVTSTAGGAVIALGEFVLSLFDRGPPQSGGSTAERLAERRRDAALERMSRTLKRDKTVRGEDVVALMYRDITKIRNMGDQALVDMIDDLNRRRQISRELER